jgi:hypothetical protein
MNKGCMRYILRHLKNCSFLLTVCTTTFGLEASLDQIAPKTVQLLNKHNNLLNGRDQKLIHSLASKKDTLLSSSTTHKKHVTRSLAQKYDSSIEMLQSVHEQLETKLLKSTDNCQYLQASVALAYFDAFPTSLRTAAATNECITYFPQDLQEKIVAILQKNANIIRQFGILSYFDTNKSPTSVLYNRLKKFRAWQLSCSVNNERLSTGTHNNWLSQYAAYFNSFDDLKMTLRQIKNDIDNTGYIIKSMLEYRPGSEDFDRETQSMLSLQAHNGQHIAPEKIYHWDIQTPLSDFLSKSFYNHDGVVLKTLQHSFDLAVTVDDTTLACRGKHSTTLFKLLRQQHLNRFGPLESSVYDTMFVEYQKQLLSEMALHEKGIKTTDTILNAILVIKNLAEEKKTSLINTLPLWRGYGAIADFLNSKQDLVYTAVEQNLYFHAFCTDPTIRKRCKQVSATGTTKLYTPESHKPVKYTPEKPTSTTPASQFSSNTPTQATLRENMEFFSLHAITALTPVALSLLPLMPRFALAVLNMGLFGSAALYTQPIIWAAGSAVGAMLGYRELAKNDRYKTIFQNYIRSKRNNHSTFDRARAVVTPILINNMLYTAAITGTLSVAYLCGTRILPTLLRRH